MRWYVKCLVDNLKSAIPGHAALRRLKRKACGYHPADARADYAIAEGLRMIGLIQTRRPLAGLDALEIGAGWEPLLPILFTLAGARRVVTADLHRLCDDQTFAGAVEALRRNAAAIAAGLSISPAQVDTFLSALRGLNMDEGLRRIGIDYLAPCDCRSIPLPDASIDVVFSRDVLEHVPAPVIRGIFRDAGRVLRPGGVACHFIDPSDHWEHGDKSISRINFLRFSDSVYQLTYLNALNYHNRLRHPEYVAMLRDTGYEIASESRVVDERALLALRSMPLAPRFRAFSPEDLATVDSFLLAVRH